MTDGFFSGEQDLYAEFQQLVNRILQQGSLPSDEEITRIERMLDDVVREGSDDDQCRFSQLLLSVSESRGETDRLGVFFKAVHAKLEQLSGREFSLEGTFSQLAL